MASNWETVIPVCVARINSDRPFPLLSASVFRSPSIAALNGCFSFHSHDFAAADGANLGHDEGTSAGSLLNNS